MKISVVTPSFNQSGWLRLALASVRDQVELGNPEFSAGGLGKDSEIRGQRSEVGQDPDIQLPILPAPQFTVEHIVVDGGSTDDSVAVLEAWGMGPGARDGEERSEVRDQTSEIGEDSAMLHTPYTFRYTSEADAGMYDAINKGFNHATGDILAYLNCDEQYLPGTLDLVEMYFRDNPGVDILFGDALLVDEGVPVAYRRMILPKKKHLETSPLNTLTCATFFRRRVLDSGLRYDTRWHVIADKAWVYDALQKQMVMAVVKKPLAAFHFTGSNLSESSWAEEDLHKWRQLHTDVLGGYHRFWHRLKKFFAGAYWKKELETFLYRKDSPHRRVSTGRVHLGFSWRNPRSGTIRS